MYISLIKIMTIVIIVSQIYTTAFTGRIIHNPIPVLTSPSRRK